MVATMSELSAFIHDNGGLVFLVVIGLFGLAYGVLGVWMERR